MATLDDLLNEGQAPSSGNSLDSLVSDVGPGTTPVTAVGEAPVSLDSILGEHQKGMGELTLKEIGAKIGDVYTKVGEWAAKPNTLQRTTPSTFTDRFVENLGKGAVGLGIGLTELSKAELKGLKEWITKPKESYEALTKEGPSVINEMMIQPIIADIQELFTHPIKYTYEKPISQILNIAMVSGMGAGVKGMQEAGKVSRASAYIETANKAMEAGDLTAAAVAKNAAMETMGKINKTGLQKLSPAYDSLVEDLGYQQWLEKFSPMTSRGIKPAVVREIKPMSAKQQLGKFSKEAVAVVQEEKKFKAPQVEEIDVPNIFGFGGSSKIVVNKNLGSAEKLSALKHELGHALESQFSLAEDSKLVKELGLESDVVKKSINRREAIAENIHQILVGNKEVIQKSPLLKALVDKHITADLLGGLMKKLSPGGKGVEIKHIPLKKSPVANYRELMKRADEFTPDEYAKEAVRVNASALIPEADAINQLRGARQMSREEASNLLKGIPKDANGQLLVEEVAKKVHGELTRIPPRDVEVPATPSSKPRPKEMGTAYQMTKEGEYLPVDSEHYDSFLKNANKFGIKPDLAKKLRSIGDRLENEQEVSKAELALYTKEMKRPFKEGAVDLTIQGDELSIRTEGSFTPKVIDNILAFLDEHDYTPKKIFWDSGKKSGTSTPEKFFGKKFTEKRVVPQEAESFFEESPEPSITDYIREHAMGNAADVIPEGKLDAINYERFLRDRAAGPVKKVLVEPQYLGDYHSIKPALTGLPKASGETPNSANRIANHWYANVQKMVHPEHGQTFTAQNYKPQGEFPKIPGRIYPWIRMGEKGKFPLSDVGAVGAKLRSPGQVMREAWGLDNPLIDAFEAQQTASLNINNSFKWFNMLTKGIKPAVNEVKQAMAPYLNNHIRLQNKLSIISDPGIREAIGKEVGANYKAAYEMQLKLAKDHSDVRIQLYAADQLPAEVVKLMSTRELKIGEMVKAYYAKTGKDMERVGLPTVSGKAYTRHLVAEEFQKANGDWTKVPDYIKDQIPKDMAFAHRTAEFDWYPSLIGAMENYIPVVEKKVAFEPFLKHWKDTIDVAAQSGNRAAQEAKAMITRNMFKGHTLASKVSGAITSTNYFLQLFGNARVAMKHIIGGMPGSWSEVGIFTAPQVLGEMVRHPLQSQELIKTFGRLSDVIKTMEMNSGIDVHANRFLKAIAGQPVAAVEYMENGVNILGNLMKGGSRNVDPELLRRYIWNKVTSVNFRSGWDTPAAFSGPARRIAFQYSLEPFKVWDYRYELVKRALNGEADIYGTSYGSKLVQYITVIGAMETLARAHGKTIVDTMAGTPFIDLVRPKAEAPGFAIQSPKAKLGPGVKMMADVANSAAKGDLVNMLDYFVDYGIESGVGILGQLMKVGSGKIPKEYEDGVSYLLGLPEVAALEKAGAKSTRYLNHKTEVEEMMHERKIMRKNPMLKHLVIYKRDFRKKLRDFMKDPDKHIQAVMKNANSEEGSTLDAMLK